MYLCLFGILEISAPTFEKSSFRIISVEHFADSQMNGSTHRFAPEQPKKARVPITDEPMETAMEIVDARNRAEDLHDEVARLREWKHSDFVIQISR
jgi:hypothetical protein